MSSPVDVISHTVCIFNRLLTVLEIMKTERGKWSWGILIATRLVQLSEMASFGACVYCFCSSRRHIKAVSRPISPPQFAAPLWLWDAYWSFSLSCLHPPATLWYHSVWDFLSPLSISWVSYFCLFLLTGSGSYYCHSSVRATVTHNIFFKQINVSLMRWW